jgi:hypothetical protein
MFNSLVDRDTISPCDRLSPARISHLCSPVHIYVRSRADPGYRAKCKRMPAKDIGRNQMEIHTKLPRPLSPFFIHRRRPGSMTQGGGTELLMMMLP